MSTRDDPKGWMWIEACEVIERAERLQRRFFQLTLEGPSGPAWQPPVDVFETEGELAIVVALPGVAADSIEIAIESGTLVVSGERPLPSVLQRAQVHRLEIPYGRFERRIELPPGHYEAGARDMMHGCLMLSLRRLL